MTYKLLISEDDTVINSLVRPLLEKNGYAITPQQDEAANALIISEGKKGAEEKTARRTDTGMKRVFEQDEFKYLYYPDDFETPGSTALKAASFETPDALIVMSAKNPADLAKLVEKYALHLVPVIDISGKLNGQSDLSGHAAPLRAEEIRAIAEQFRERRQSIHPDMVSSTNAHDRLLAQCYVRDLHLPASLHPSRKRLLQYPLLDDPEAIAKTANALVEEGLFDKKLSERMHVCPMCHGARLTVREVCVECRDIDLQETEIIHHYHCATQDIRENFEEGDDLICPKCERELRRFGKDYDVPAMAMSCSACSFVMEEPTIEFLCLDCNARTDGEVINTREVFDYTLTQRGREVVEAGLVQEMVTETIFRFGDIPVSIIAKINRMARQKKGDETAIMLAVLSHDSLRECEMKYGVSSINKIRKQLLNAIDEIVPSEKMARGHASDYLLYCTQDELALLDDVSQALKQAASEVSIDIEPSFEFYNEKDLFHCPQ